MSSVVPSTEILLAHAGFVRAAARAVLSGDAEVDDVVQETLIRALHTGPRSSRALRSWLSRVARNLALDVRRSRDRRARREAAAARCEAVPSVEAIAEHEEARRRLVSALLALDERYRSPLLLRYYDDLRVAEVARRLDVPLETARTRLRRGLERLRTVLDTDSRSNRTALAVALGYEAAPTVVLGGIAMKKTLTAVAILVLCLGAGVVILLRTGGSQDVPSDHSEALEAENTQETAPSGTGPSLATASRDADSARSASGKQFPFAAGVVVDHEGHPVSDVTVLMRGRRRMPWDDKKQDAGYEFHRALADPAARTDQEGQFEIAEPIEDFVSLDFLKAGYGWVELRALDADRSKNQELRVVLDPGRRFTLLVEDTDGRPIQGARLSFWFASDSAGHTLFGGHTTDASGRCSVAWLTDCEDPIKQLSVSGPGYAHQIRRPPTLREEETVVLWRNAPIVSVKDSTTGAPVAAAGGLIYDTSDGSFASALTADPLGEAWFVTAPGVLVANPWQPSRVGTFRAAVFGEGHLSGEATFRVIASKEPPRVEVELAPGVAHVALEGTAQPAESITLDLRTPHPRGYSQAESQLPLVLHIPVATDGAFVVRGLPAGEYRLTATAPGYAPACAEVRAPERNLRVALTKAAELDVLVRGTAGAPAASKWVTVQVDGRVAAWSHQTDADGIAHFEGLPGGKLHVLPVRVGGRLKPDLFPHHETVELKAGEKARVEIRLPSRLAATFRARDERDQPCLGLSVKLRIRDGWGGYVKGEFKRVDAWRGVTDENGEATVEIYAGLYEVTLSQGTIQRSTRVRVPGGEGVIDLSWLTVGATITGRVLEKATGAPIAGRLIIVGLDEPNARGRVGQAVTDAEGRYEIAGLPSRPLRVMYAMRGLPPRGVFDPNSPYAVGLWSVTLGPRERRVRDVLVPRVRGEGAEEAVVEVSVLVVEQETRTPLPKVSVFVKAFRDGLWFSVGDIETGPDGRAEGRVVHGERFRVRAVRSVREKGITHKDRQEAEAVPEAKRIDVEVSLPRRPSTSR